MGEVRWTLAALDDLDLIKDFIAQDSPAQASIFGERIIEATRRLAEFPLSGKVTPETDDKARREILVGDYRIMYRVEGEVVYVTRVFHGARDYKP